jgi:hypothetical protein
MPLKMFQLMIDGMKPLPSWGPASRTKQQQYADVEINVKECESNPAFARLMGSSLLLQQKELCPK